LLISRHSFDAAARLFAMMPPPRHAVSLLRQMFSPDAMPYATRVITPMMPLLMPQKKKKKGSAPRDNAIYCADARYADALFAADAARRRRARRPRAPRTPCHAACHVR
jgi:hypothetical protein